MTHGRKRYLTRSLLAGALLAPAILSSCAFYNPFSGNQRGYVAPRELGEGDCSVVVLNLSSRPLEVYFYLGLREPPRVTAGWPRMGLLEPGESTVLHADCDRRRVTVQAYATSPVDTSREYTNVRREMALVKGRRDVMRLRLVR